MDGSRFLCCLLTQRKMQYCPSDENADGAHSPGASWAALSASTPSTAAPGPLDFVLPCKFLRAPHLHSHMSLQETSSSFSCLADFNNRRQTTSRS
ncbi:hypothetical protein EV1_029647 [Malus domestica]